MERASTPNRMEKVDVKARLKGRKRIGSDRFQKPARGLVAPHQEVLTIVDHITGGFIDEGVRPAAEMLTLLDEKHRDSA
jgi:hypothetical protein